MIRHKKVGEICYTYEQKTVQKYIGRCTDPKHNPPEEKKKERKK